MYPGRRSQQRPLEMRWAIRGLGSAGIASVMPSLSIPLACSIPCGGWAPPGPGRMIWKREGSLAHLAVRPAGPIIEQTIPPTCTAPSARLQVRRPVASRFALTGRYRLSGSAPGRLPPVPWRPGCPGHCSPDQFPLDAAPAVCSPLPRRGRVLHWLRDVCSPARPKGKCPRPGGGGSRCHLEPDLQHPVRLWRGDELTISRAKAQATWGPVLRGGAVPWAPACWTRTNCFPVRG
jgi:hypothetical protein